MPAHYAHTSHSASSSLHFPLQRHDPSAWNTVPESREVGFLDDKRELSKRDTRDAVNVSSLETPRAHTLDNLPTVQFDRCWVSQSVSGITQHPWDGNRRGI
ncbi:hypothetical protein RRG08_031530 [Elysia crispata]|uniref:Uncharacterized protein n=1 Tax=Elysia crispata TaxID=231223 RepID=A0AAE1DAD9_9GAST|nr:hypothetical protein RRG08_031530 [Elysia crispata]